MIYVRYILNLLNFLNLNVITNMKKSTVVKFLGIVKYVVTWLLGVLSSNVI